MQSQRSSQKRAGKKIHFFELQNLFFFFIFLLCKAKGAAKQEQERKYVFSNCKTLFFFIFLLCKAKGTAKKEQERKYVFSNCTTWFFSFFIFILLALPTSSVHKLFSFFFQTERFRLLWNRHLKLYKSSCNSKGNKIIFKDIFWGVRK